MSATASTRLGLPKTSTNRLGDALEWLKSGDCLILSTKGKKKQIFKHIFHHCVHKGKGTEDIPLDSLRVIYIVVHPETREKWQTVFEVAGHQICACNIQANIHSNLSSFPYKYQADI